MTNRGTHTVRTEPTQAKRVRNYPVALVGAGTGDEGLITLRARELLEQADIVVYDYLASAHVLAFAPEGAERIFVGKKGFSQHVTQDEINDLLIALAQEHPDARIVRLKGGDPFVFGRGGEEALALGEAGISFEVVPGVTAGVAAPAYAGIPVTHRGVASSVAFVTGNETPDKPESFIHWNELAHGVDTICFYMGIKNLPTICMRLLEAGRAPDTPVALVRWGTLPSQEVLISRLSEVVDEVRRVGFEAPAIIVVGDVVNLRDRLIWFEQAPLFGKHIVVTRSRTQASALTTALTTRGAQVEELPTITIEPIEASEPIERAIAQLDDYDWAVFTSANGVSCFFTQLAARGKDARAFGGARIAAIGSATAAALKRHGITADVVPSEYRGEAAARAIIDAGLGDGRVLIARAEVARDVLPAMLRDAGAQVDVVALYRTVAGSTSDAARIKALLEQGSIDAITFTSSSTVENFCRLMSGLEEQQRPASQDEAPQSFDVNGSAMASLLEGVDLFSIGPITSQTLRDHGLEPAAEAYVYTIDGLVEAMVEAYGEGADVDGQ